MIAGTSVPSERVNYQALLKENVGLIVNLTENPVTGRGNPMCSECEFTTDDVDFDSDMFEDVKLEDDLNCLFLPIRDGMVPHFEQIDTFLKHAKETIDKGRKVVVHCHAGVGRTGTFLAIWLMTKYNLTPEEAIMKLRFQRPHSMQFNPDDWYVNPYLIRRADAYQRNLFQERYVHLYYNEKIAPTTPTKKEIQREFGITTPDTTPENSVNGEFFTIETETSEASLESGDSDFVYENTFDDEEVDDELKKLIEKLNVGNERENGKDFCFVCQNVSSIGPSPILSGQEWPPKDVHIVYMK
jgi:protein-tyrosine phosphatase